MLLQDPIKTGTRVTATTGIRAMETTTTTATVIRATEDTVAMTILVTTTIMATVTMTVSSLLRHPTQFLTAVKS